MLNVYFGKIDFKDKPNYVVQSIDAMFDYYFEENWMTCDWAKYIIKEIDRSEIVQAKLIDSPLLGTIPYTWISAGAKSLIMMNADQGLMFNGNNMGDNCYPYVFELARTKDIYMFLEYLPDFEWKEDYVVVCLNDNQLITDSRTFVSVNIRYTVDAPTVSAAELIWPEVKSDMLE